MLGPGGTLSPRGALSFTGGVREWMMGRTAGTNCCADFGAESGHQSVKATRQCTFAIHAGNGQ